MEKALLARDRIKEEFEVSRIQFNDKNDFT